MKIHQATHEFLVATPGRGLHDFTREILGWMREVAVDEGLLTLHVQHTSASLIVQENADPEVQRDLERFFERLVPRGDPIFRHTSGSP